MEKKYQVFVSSTYKDLVEERQEVMQALLEQDCIPVGMELFPAADDDQWTLIKRLIDDCDYYIVIIGGRYGSTNEEGISYTQMEYEYAHSIGVPILGFLNKEPGKITSEKTDKAELLIQKLNDFKILVQKKLCKYYTSPAELGGLVSRSLIRLIKDKPRPGWVKATLLPSEDLTKELLQSQKQIQQLKAEINKINTSAPTGTEDLSQGEDNFIIKYSTCSNGWHTFGEEKSGFGEIRITWNEIFRIISPLMIDEEEENRIAHTLTSFIRKRVTTFEISEVFGQTEKESSIAISKDNFLLIIVQFKALGLIKKSIKKRSLNNTQTYWTLTPYGEALMTKLLAIKKMPIENLLS